MTLGFPLCLGCEIDVHEKCQEDLTKGCVELVRHFFSCNHLLRVTSLVQIANGCVIYSA